MIEIIVCTLVAIGYIYLFTRGIRNVFKSDTNLNVYHIVPYN